MSDSTSSSKKPIFIGAGVVALAILAWLAFGFFGIQAAFIDNEVSESADDLFTSAPAEVSDEAEEAEAEEQADDLVAEGETAVDDDPPAIEDPEAEPAEEAEEPADPADQTEEPETEEPVQEIFTAASGNFSSLSSYDVSGDALVLSNGTDQRFLRFENFASTNGPDLKVYLRAASGEFVSLGDLTGNIGDQNYEIPADVDLAVFNTVEIWCERFSVGFGEATLS